MAQILLPPDTALLSTQQVALVVRQGVATPREAPQYPDFFVPTEVIRNLIPADLEHRFRDYGKGRMPAMPTAQGLVFDPDWTPFSAFDVDETVQHIDIALVSDIETGQVPWQLQCPVMREHASLIGLLIAQYGKQTGGDPANPGMNDTEFIRLHPLSGLLRNASSQELMAFRDRGRSLLDLAMDNQQWRLAGFLWDQGVRWSEEALVTGKPLEALVLSTLGLMGMLVMRPNDALEASSRDDGEPRVAWLKTWLERYAQAGGVANPAPTLTVRGLLAQKSGWREGEDIIDSPAGLWISRFLVAGSMAKGLPKMEQAPAYQRDLVDTWVRYWGGQGIDLSQVPVRRGQGEIVGFRNFWHDDRHRHHGVWAERVETLNLEARLEAGTPVAKKTTRAVRL